MRKMRKLIADIVIGERFRKDLGDVESLARSIQARRLINPVTIDKSGALLAGHRRIEAAKLLGWTEIDVREIDTLGEAVEEIKIERDENTERKPMTQPELAALAVALADAEAPNAAARSGARTDRQPDGPQAQRFGSVPDVIAPALGVSPSVAKDLLYVGRKAQSEDVDEREAGREALAKMDQGVGTRRAAQEARDRLASQQQPVDQRRVKQTDMIRSVDQVTIMDRVASTCSGVADMVADIKRRIPSGVNEDVESEKVAQWTRDLKAASRAIAGLISTLAKGQGNRDVQDHES